MSSGLLARARVFVATIASCWRVLETWGELAMPDALEMHTVVVDECGCTAESSTALLASLRPKNLLLVGDHKQLPPFSAVPPGVAAGKRYPRSLLERCMAASGTAHLLSEQYRMHPQVSSSSRTRPIPYHGSPEPEMQQHTLQQAHDCDMTHSMRRSRRTSRGRSTAGASRRLRRSQRRAPRRARYASPPSLPY